MVSDQDFIAKVPETPQKSRDIGMRLQRNEINWLGLGVPVAAWAAPVPSPDVAPPEQLPNLWDAVFEICRMNEPDPVAAWQSHIADLRARACYMEQKAYVALHYLAPKPTCSFPFRKDTIGWAVVKQHPWLCFLSKHSNGRSVHCTRPPWHKRTRYHDQTARRPGHRH